MTPALQRTRLRSWLKWEKTECRGFCYTKEYHREKVKITVVKKEFFKDLAEEYLTEGDTFLFEGNAQMPERNNGCQALPASLCQKRCHAS